MSTRYIPVRHKNTETTQFVYTRPSDWIDISSVNNNEINLLVLDSLPVGFNVTTSSGTYSIDWGDGTIETGRASATNYQHLYTAGAGTACSLGYFTRKVRIYGASGNIINFKITPTTYIGVSAQESPILWAVFGTTGLTTLDNAFYNTGTPTVSGHLLEEVTLPSTLPSCATLLSAFRNCYHLQKVTLPTSWGASTTSVSYMFNTCSSLCSIDLPSSWNNISSVTYMFQNCLSLTSITLPASFGSVTDVTSFLATCFGLNTIKGLTSWGSVSTVSNIINGCSNLSRFDLPTTWGNSMLSLNNFFGGGTDLRQVTLPSSWNNVTSVSQFFMNNTKIRTVALPASWGSITDVSQFFNGCTSLVDVNLPSTWGSVTNASSMFISCTSLKRVVLPSSWGSMTNISSMFSTCKALSFVILPTSWDSVNNIGSLFTTCQSLSDITLPASLGVITTVVSLFENCYCLKTVKIPTSWGSAMLTIDKMFSGCTSLYEVVLPAATENLIQATDSVFKNCYNLKILTNFDKIGTLGAKLCSLTSGFDYCTSLPSLTVACKLAKFSFNGATTIISSITSLRLTNSASTYTGTSPQVSIQYAALDAAALDQLFTDLPTLTGKTINITGCTGAATCNRTIATAKGWTVTG